MLKRTLTPMALAATLALPSLVAAQPGWGGGPGGPGGRGGKMGMHVTPEMLDMAADRLGLDADTTARLKELVYASREEGIELKAEVERARLQLHRLMDSESPPESDVMAAVEALGEAQTRMRKHKIGLMLEIRKHLTADQVQELKKMRRERRAKHRGRRGGRHGFGPPPVPGTPGVPAPPAATGQ